MQRIFFSIVLIILILYMITGCGMGNVNLPSKDENQIQEDEVKDDFETTSESNIEPSTPKKGGSLSIPIPQLDTLNPLLTQSKELINFFELIYEGMFSYDQNLKPVPDLVETWEVTEDAKIWKFHLKKGIKWHNGLELTAEDIKFTFEILRDFPDATNSYYGQSLFKNAEIESVEIADSDPYTVVVTLSQPFGNLCSLMTFPILSKAIYQSVEFVAEYKEKINLELLVGTGPYKVDTQNSDGGKYIKLVRNTQWWGNEPYIDFIVAKIYRDNEEEREAFQNKEVDLLDTHVLFAENYAMGEDTRLYRYLTQSYDFIGINFRKNTLLQDRRVRQAIAYGLDRKDIIFKAYFNNSLAVDVPIPSDSWLYDPNFRKYDYNPDKAIKILNDAGWTDLDKDGFFEKIEGDGEIELSFSLIVNEDDNVRKDVAKLIQTQMGIIGIKVELQFLPWDEMEQVLEEGSFDAVLAGYYLDFSADLYFAFHSSRIGNELNNFIGYNSTELDELLDRARVTTDHQELVRVYKDIQNHLARELPFISLYFRTNSLIVRDKVKGISFPREMHIYSNIEEWYLEE